MSQILVSVCFQTINLASISLFIHLKSTIINKKQSLLFDINQSHPPSSIHFCTRQIQIYNINISMPPPPINTLNCLILESKSYLKYIPHESQVYYVNSKRRFMVYFKHYEQMIDAMKVLTSLNVPYYRRQSLLPDREELEELVYHCNYRFKRVDLRRNIYHSTPYNEPKLYFDKYERVRNKFEQHKKIENKLPVDELLQPQPIEQKMVSQQLETTPTGYQFKNEEVKNILENKELLKSIFMYLGAC